ncbi:CcmD family protein [Kallotenue papyrolyticum]|uniref:CcmD family protein n=1 Tax=Kallotenue papyrolyticum TaxID=1325125 RepID=UPI000492B8C6|nr:hypothetical protein [Kallotenue papyrolyticum]
MPDVINNPALAMYVAAAVALVVMLGFLIYLWRLDARVRELRRALDSQAAGAARTVERQSEHEPQRLQRIERELQDGLNHP